MTRTCLKGCAVGYGRHHCGRRPYWFRAEAQLMSQWNVPWTEQIRCLVVALYPSMRSWPSAGVALSTREIIEQLSTRSSAKRRSHP